jgi:acyl carrier protein
MHMSLDSKEHPVASRSAEEIQQWLVDYLAAALQKSPDTIDVTVPFDSFTLDSAAAMEMTGKLESWLGRRVDPTLVYDYPTIEQFSKCFEEES